MKVKNDEEESTSKGNDLVKKYVGKYWNTAVHITGFGQVNGGKATEEQLMAFIAVMNPATNLDEWLSDKDVYAEYVKKNTIKTGTTK